MERTATLSGVYVIAPSEKGPCKIGHARNVLARLSRLQVGNHLKLELYSVWTSKYLPPIKAEGFIHKRLASRSIRGEWFDFSVEEVNNIIGWMNDKALFKHDNLESGDRLRIAMQAHPLA